MAAARLRGGQEGIIDAGAEERKTGRILNPRQKERLHEAETVIKERHSG